MSYDKPDPYYQPEHFKLTFLGSLDEPNMSYEFHILQVWIHESGKMYYAEDSGCSCPSPFENLHKLEDLTELNDYTEFAQRVDDFYVREEGDTSAFQVEKVELLRTVSQYLRDPDFTELKASLVEMESDLSRT